MHDFLRDGANFPGMALRGYGAYLREAREGLGLTQEDVGAMIGVSGSQVSRIENEADGQAPTVPDQVNVLVHELRLSAETLLEKMGVEISSRGPRRIPTRLVRILQGMPDRRLLGLIDFLEDLPPSRAESAQK